MKKTREWTEDGVRCRCPAQLVWRESGRHWVADVGRLSLRVRVHGRKGDVARRWLIRDVFGNSNPRNCERMHSDLDSALLEAERVGANEFSFAAACLRGYGYDP